MSLRYAVNVKLITHGSRCQLTISTDLTWFHPLSDQVLKPRKRPLVNLVKSPEQIIKLGAQKRQESQ